MGNVTTKTTINGIDINDMLNPRAALNRQINIFNNTITTSINLKKYSAIRIKNQRGKRFLSRRLMDGTEGIVVDISKDGIVKIDTQIEGQVELSLNDVEILDKEPVWIQIYKNRHNINTKKYGWSGGKFQSENFFHVY